MEKEAEPADRADIARRQRSAVTIDKNPMKPIFPTALILFATAAAGLCGETVVDYRSLNRDVKILGQLGVPLGQIVEIYAAIVAGRTLHNKEDEGSYLLKVSKVGPKLLPDQPVCCFMTHSWADVKIASDEFSLYKMKTGRKTGSLTSSEVEKLEMGYVGRTYRLLVYEEGRFSGMPAGLPEDYPVWQDRGFGFDSYLVVLRIIEPAQQSGQTLAPAPTAVTPPAPQEARQP